MIVFSHLTPDGAASTECSHNRAKMIAGEGVRFSYLTF